MPLTPEEKREMLVHVGYEWWMFRATFEQLKTISDEGDVVRNALVESLAIHGRGLILFFYESGAKYIGDVTCDDYGVPREPMPTTGAVFEWKRDADKRIAHVTDTRLDELKAWRTGDVHTALETKMNALRVALAADVPPKWIADDPTSTIHDLKRRVGYADGEASPMTTDGHYVSGTKSGFASIGSLRGTDTVLVSTRILPKLPDKE